MPSPKPHNIANPFPKPGFYRRLGKPALDLLLTLAALPLALPLMLLTALTLLFLNRGKVFFTQTRPGLHGKLFRLYKFRTMTDARDAEGRLLPDAQRLTGFGRLIRATSLDELPQLLNILRGEMSWVGPRPLLPEYLPLYSPRQALRHTVRPGITGLAQVKGRNALEWATRLELDAQYAESIRFGLDLWILGQTLLKIFAGQTETVIIERFAGNTGESPPMKSHKKARHPREGGDLSPRKNRA